MPTGRRSWHFLSIRNQKILIFYTLSARSQNDFFRPGNPAHEGVLPDVTLRSLGRFLPLNSNSSVGSESESPAVMGAFPFLAGLVDFDVVGSSFRGSEPAESLRNSKRSEFCSVVGSLGFALAG